MQALEALLCHTNDWLHPKMLNGLLESNAFEMIHIHVAFNHCFDKIEGTLGANLLPKPHQLIWVGWHRGGWINVVCPVFMIMILSCGIFFNGPAELWQGLPSCDTFFNGLAELTRARYKYKRLSTIYKSAMQAIAEQVRDLVIEEHNYSERIFKELDPGYNVKVINPITISNVHENGFTLKEATMDELYVVTKHEDGYRVVEQNEWVDGDYHEVWTVPLLPSVKVTRKMPGLGKRAKARFTHKKGKKSKAPPAKPREAEYTHYPKRNVGMTVERLAQMVADRIQMLV